MLWHATFSQLLACRTINESNIYFPIVIYETLYTSLHPTTKISLKNPHNICHTIAILSLIKSENMLHIQITIPYLYTYHYPLSKAFMRSQVYRTQPAMSEA